MTNFCFWKEVRSGRNFAWQTFCVLFIHNPRFMAFSGANLTIPQVKREDRGRYICDASNGIGVAVTKAVLLEVSFGPIVAAKRPKTGQKEGYEADLICKVTAYPPAAVSWTRDDKELNNDDHYEISYKGVTNEETISTLRFKSVAEHHFGSYVCKAKNAFGAAETTFELFGKSEDCLQPNRLATFEWSPLHCATTPSSD